MHHLSRSYSDPLSYALPGESYPHDRPLMFEAGEVDEEAVDAFDQVALIAGRSDPVGEGMILVGECGEEGLGLPKGEPDRPFLLLLP